MGNRLTASGVPHAYDAANRLLRAGPVTYAYDRIGNRTAQHDPSGGSMTFTYDGANRLVAVDPASVVTRTLSPGWNFIASPFLGASVDVKNALSPLSLNTDYDQVSRYDTAGGRFQGGRGRSMWGHTTMIQGSQTVPEWSVPKGNA